MRKDIVEDIIADMVGAGSGKSRTWWVRRAVTSTEDRVEDIPHYLLRFHFVIPS